MVGESHLVCLLELEEWICWWFLCAVLVLLDLVKVSFCCGRSVRLVGLEVVDREAWDGMNVFVLECFEHGGRYRGKENSMSVEDAFCDVGSGRVGGG